MIKQSISVPALVLAFTLATVPKSIALVSRNDFPLTQSSNLIAAAPSTQATPSGTTVRIHGSTSMTGINAVLVQEFEHQFSGAKVEIEYTSTDAALSALEKGKIDLAAIGRTLTQDEIKNGLIQVPISRRKIAIVIGEDNTFEGSLTIEQFAQIFRGEITDWSEIGGEPGPIRFVNRSSTSYARQALPSYAVFQQAPFVAGENSEQLPHDKPESMIMSMIESLGSDGISYAIAAQVFDRPHVRLVPMHQTLPNEPEYPFSKLLSYVYKGPEPNQAVQDYLTFATSPENKAVIETARRGGAISSKHGDLSIEAAYNNFSESETTATKSGSAGSSAENNTGDAYSSSEKSLTPTGLFPWWRWFVIVPIAGIFLWSLINRGQSGIDDA